MIAPDLETAIDELQNLVEAARVIAPFTGAGISTECGIPDFRSPGGLWTKNKPIPFDEFLASQDMRNEAWRRRFAMDAQFAAARPGRGHLALAQLHRAGKAPAVITQNIDNLHQSSGISAEHVIELHGNNSYALCLDCGKRYELAWVRRAVRAGARARPRLRRLRRTYQDRDHLLRPGDARARDAPRRAVDVLTVIYFSQSAPRWWYGRPPGSPCWPNETALVWSIINREATEFDEIADLVVREDIGTVLSPFIVH